MSDDHPTRDLDHQAGDELETVELPERWRGSSRQGAAWRRESGQAAHRPPSQPFDETQALPDDLGQPPQDETQVIPDDLLSEPGRVAGARGNGLADTQPINLDTGWHRRMAQRPHAPAPDWSRQRPPAGWGHAGGWDQPGQPHDTAGWESGPPIWQQPAARAELRPLPEAGRIPGEAEVQEAPRRSRTGGQHLLVWVFTLLLALGLGVTVVLGPWAEPLELSGQASALLIVVVSLLAWTLLSLLLRIAGVIAFVFTPLLFLAGSVPELQRLPVTIPQVTASATVMAVALGLSSWLAGHWFFYARKGWWRSRLARAILSNIPGVDDARDRPDV
jgi:hypothetical protein